VGAPFYIPMSNDESCNFSTFSITLVIAHVFEYSYLGRYETAFVGFDFHFPDG
jgi:hypothetical protein